LNFNFYIYTGTPASGEKVNNFKCWRCFGDTERVFIFFGESSKWTNQCYMWECLLYYFII